MSEISNAFSKFCRSYLDGKKCHRQGCTFAHSEKEIAFQECNYGNDCRNIAYEGQDACTYLHPDETCEERIKLLKAGAKRDESTHVQRIEVDPSAVGTWSDILTLHKRDKDNGTFHTFKKVTYQKSEKVESSTQQQPSAQQQVVRPPAERKVHPSAIVPPGGVWQKRGTKPAPQVQQVQQVKVEQKNENNDYVMVPNVEPSQPENTMRQITLDDLMSSNHVKPREEIPSDSVSEANTSPNNQEESITLKIPASVYSTISSSIPEIFAILSKLNVSFAIVVGKQK